MPVPVQLGFLLLITMTSALSAQHASPGIPGPGPSPVLGVVARGPLWRSLPLDSVRREISPTHWKKGAVIGGLVTGLGLALLIDGFCRSSDAGGNCGGALVGGFATGGVIGAVVGALIGGQVPKTDDP